MDIIFVIFGIVGIAAAVATLAIVVSLFKKAHDVFYSYVDSVAEEAKDYIEHRKKEEDAIVEKATARISELADKAIKAAAEKNH